MQQRDPLTRERVELRSCDQGRYENNAFALLAMQPINCNKANYLGYTILHSFLSENAISCDERYRSATNTTSADTSKLL